MRVGDTIVAVGSPPGRAARALVRVSGPGVRGALRDVLDPMPNGAGACVSRLRLPIYGLPVLAAVYAAPRSYTGEDAAELLAPGNPRLVDRVVDLLLACPGFRQAEPGEFTARAYLNGRLTLDEADGVAATIAAATAEQLAAAASLLGGSAGASYRALADELATLLALVEAGLDFTDQEDVRPIEPEDLRRRLGAVLGAIEASLGSARGASIGPELPTVVLVGAPNSGKSTLFNALLGRRRAVASPIAGTTRDVLAERLELAGDAPGADGVVLVDVAGLDALAGGEGAPIPGTPAAEARRHALEALAAADVAVHCDPAGRFDGLAMPARAIVIRVSTKADLPGASTRRVTADGGGHSGVLPVCAMDGWNVAALRRAIAEAAWAGQTSGVAALVPRHRRGLAATRDRLGEALETIDRSACDGAAVADSVRGALDALGELTGRIAPDEVIGRIFSSFCVGK